MKTEGGKNMKMSNKMYDVLRLISSIPLPLAALITAIADIWGMPYGIEISSTLLAIDTFLGTWLKVSNDEYKKANRDR